MGVRGHGCAPESAHRTRVHVGAQDVRVRGAREHVEAAGGCSGVLACRIRVMLHRREV